MKTKGWVFLGLIVFCSSTYARTVTCTGGRDPISFSVPADKITAGLSGNTTTYRELYSISTDFNNSNSTCKASASGAKLGWLEYAYSTSGKEPVLVGSDYIFPTKIDGIGISFYDTNVTQRSIGSFTTGAVNRATWNLTTNNYTWQANFSIKIKLWKIPGKFNPAQFNSSGMLEFDDIKIVQALQITSSGDTWAADQPNRGPSPLPGSWTTNEVSITGGVNVWPGTCDFADQKINLGKYNMAQVSNSTPWKDISFTINCPPAWGYGGGLTTKKNTSGIILTVYERTGIEDAARGIIKLRPGGAEGYGIQLACNTAASQPVTGDPGSANKIVFNQPKVITTTNYGNTGQPTTQLINMAARYIRTSGDAKAGLADGAIEIVASYN